MNSVWYFSITNCHSQSRWLEKPWNFYNCYFFLTLLFQSKRIHIQSMPYQHAIMHCPCVNRNESASSCLKILNFTVKWGRISAGWRISKFFGRILADFYQNFGRFLTEFWKIFVWILADFWLNFGRFLTEFWQIFVWILADFWLNFDRFLKFLIYFR
jgi:hypothetical protein